MQTALRSDLQSENSGRKEVFELENSDEQAPPPRRLREMGLLERSLHHTAELIANVTEAHTAAIFLLDPRNQTLHVAGAQTLSRVFNMNAVIPVGSGLIGWTAENKVRISVCPFEHDARTLACYEANEPLKSFIAVPILDERKELIGVIACDSMKSYAFPKLTEKLLLNCGEQILSLLAMDTEIQRDKGAVVYEPPVLERFLEELRSFGTERELLTHACGIPQSIIRREALVVLSVAENGIGEGNFYGVPAESRLGNRLLDLVCKHKRVICGERVVQATTNDDASGRTFLSVPFHSLGQEAGSFNLITPPRSSFRPAEISALERIARVVGSELERIRLRDRTTFHHEAAGLVSWRTFSLQARKLLARSEAERGSLSLVRVYFPNIATIEQRIGTSGMTTLMQRVFRLVQQVRPTGSPACFLYSSQILFLMEASEVRRTVQRLTNLLSRLSLEDVTGERISTSENPASLLAQHMTVAIASTPKDGTSLEQLGLRTLTQLGGEPNGTAGQSEQRSAPATAPDILSRRFPNEPRSAKRAWGLFSSR